MRCAVSYDMQRCIAHCISWYRCVQIFYLLLIPYAPSPSCIQMSHIDAHTITSGSLHSSTYTCYTVRHDVFFCRVLILLCPRYVADYCNTIFHISCIGFQSFSLPHRASSRLDSTRLVYRSHSDHHIHVVRPFLSLPLLCGKICVYRIVAVNLSTRFQVLF